MSASDYRRGVTLIKILIPMRGNERQGLSRAIQVLRDPNPHEG